MKYVPKHYQEEATDFLCATPQASLFLDMGLGKTVITLTAIARMIDSCQIRSALVLAPLRVCRLVWPQELKKWHHLRWMELATLAVPTAFKLDALRTQAHVYLCNYDALPWLCEWMALPAQQKKLPFDMLVFDESSKMKSPSTTRFKSLRPHLPRFKRRAIMSGTPAAEGYEGLWSQYYCVDLGQRLGEFVTHYRDRFFHFKGYQHYQRTINDGAADTINGMIADCTLVMSAKDHLDIPALTTNRVEVEMPPKLLPKYKIFEKEMFLELEKKTIHAANAAVVSGKCRQFTGGGIYSHDAGEAQAWEHLHDAKLDALADIIDDAQGTPILVAIDFKHERTRIAKRFKQTVSLGSGKRDEQIVERWNKGEIPLMVVHPASIGHGVNLQYGGHILVWFSIAWSGELYGQTVARLHRQGQDKPVIVHQIIMRGTIDEIVSQTVAAKLTTQADFLDALTAYKKGNP